MISLFSRSTFSSVLPARKDIIVKPQSHLKFGAGAEEHGDQFVPHQGPMALKTWLNVPIPMD